jgi:hypothetical protein
MRIIALYLVFTFYFFISTLAYAVPADANIIQQIRGWKTLKQSQLSQSIEDTKDELMVSRRVRVLTQHERDKLNSGYGRSNRENKNSRKKDVRTFSSEDEKREKLNELQSKLKEYQHRFDAVEANDMNYIVDPFKSFGVGRIGRVGPSVEGMMQGMQIIGIINDHESIVEYTVNYQLISVGGPVKYPDPVTATIWLKGVSTAGLVDRSLIVPPPVLIISGTKDYETVLGAKNTVFVFEPLDIPPDSL